MKKEDLKVHDWDITQIYPNSWNPNMTSKRVDEAIRESIGTYGMVDPITCRRHPELDGALQIIDGEHRLEACKEMGFKTVPVVVLDINDANAKKLTIIANETRGRAEKTSLSQLVAEIAEELDADQLMLGLPYYEDELENMIGEGVTARDVSPDKEWEGMPEFDQKDEQSYRHVIVHFETPDDAAEFFSIIGQSDTGKTKSIWFPEQQRMDTESKRYG